MRADKVLQLRKLLDKLSSVQGLMTEEKGKTVQNVKSVYSGPQIIRPPIQPAKCGLKFEGVDK